MLLGSMPDASRSAEKERWCPAPTGVAMECLPGLALIAARTSVIDPKGLSLFTKIVVGSTLYIAMGVKSRYVTFDDPNHSKVVSEDVARPSVYPSGFELAIAV